MDISQMVYYDNWSKNIAIRLTIEEREKINNNLVDKLNKFRDQNFEQFVHIDIDAMEV